MSDDLIHLSGYTPEGKRINRRYKTYEAAKRMAAKMSVVNMALLKAISREAIDRALSETEE
jgi:hypothetical protein